MDKEQPILSTLILLITRGICYALNMGRSFVETEYIVYMNDDMYVCPQWDLELFKEGLKTQEPGIFYFLLPQLNL